jgi:ribosomal protein S25
MTSEEKRKARNARYYQSKKAKQADKKQDQQEQEQPISEKRRQQARQHVLDTQTFHGPLGGRMKMNLADAHDLLRAFARDVNPLSLTRDNAPVQTGKRPEDVLPTLKNSKGIHAKGAKGRR